MSILFPCLSFYLAQTPPKSRPGANTAPITIKQTTARLTLPLWVDGGRHQQRQLAKQAKFLISPKNTESFATVTDLCAVRGTQSADRVNRRTQAH